MECPHSWPSTSNEGMRFLLGSGHAVRTWPLPRSVEERPPSFAVRATGIWTSEVQTPLHGSHARGGPDERGGALPNTGVGAAREGASRDSRAGGTTRLLLLPFDDLDLAHQPWQELPAPVELHGSEAPPLFLVCGANGSGSGSPPQEPVPDGHSLPDLQQFASHGLLPALRHPLVLIASTHVRHLSCLPRWCRSGAISAPTLPGGASLSAARTQSTSGSWVAETHAPTPWTAHRLELGQRGTHCITVALVKTFIRSLAIVS